MTHKLYELDGNTKFIIKDDPDKVVYTLHKIDGMYSVVMDNDRNIYHFRVWTEVEKV